jgi:AbiV family abortive infection protein
MRDTMNLNQLKQQDVQEIYKKVYENGCELLEDADLLYSHEKFSRAYLCAHIAFEEFGKLPMLNTVLLDLRKGKKVNWKTLNKRFRDHKGKISMSYALSLTFSNQVVMKYKLYENEQNLHTYFNEIRGFIESGIDIRQALEEFLVVHTNPELTLDTFSFRQDISKQLNDNKNLSLYADYKGREFLKPSESITFLDCEHIIMMSLIQKRIVNLKAIKNGDFDEEQIKLHKSIDSLIGFYE